MSDRQQTRASMASIVLVFGILVSFSSVAGAEPPATANGGTSQEINPAVARGIEWLLAQQQADGAWRSAKYAQLQAGPAATALAVVTLAGVTANEPEASVPGLGARRAIDNALPFLLNNLAPVGYVSSPDDASEYPTYATALTLLALDRLPSTDRGPYADAIRRMQTYLAATQVSAPLPNELATANDVGGWGLVGGEPSDPSSFRTANVSTTRYALEALAPVAAAHPETLRRARQFLIQRQNADGGFSFLSDPLDQLNKAGAIDPAREDEAFVARSYGTTTADGLLALRDAGLPENDPHVAAAVDWLNAHPRVDAVPGFPSDEVSTAAAQGLFYYYAAALAQATAAFPDAPFAARAPELAAELISRQRPDGSWANTIATMREDDPLTATCLALDALATLRDLQQR